MRLSVLAHAFSTDLPVALDASRRAGFNGVVLDPTVYPDLVDTSQTGRREIVNLLARHDQSLVGIDVRLGNLGFSPKSDLEREIDRIDRAMHLARGLRGMTVLCDLGPLPPAPDERPVTPPAIAPSMLGKLILPDPPKAAPRPAAIPRDMPFEAGVENALREVGARADRAGCLVAFRSSLGSFASLAHALAAVDCPWFGVDLDPLAMLADELPSHSIFDLLGRLVRHVRARDGVKGAGHRVQSTAIGKGQVDYAELFALCRDADYDGFVTIDSIDLPDRSRSAIRGAELLKAMIATR